MPLADDGSIHSKYVAYNIICADVLYVQVVVVLFSKTDKNIICIVRYYYAKVSWYHQFQTQNTKF